MRHGFYWRNVITLSSTLLIPIARYLCGKSGRTFSLLPIPAVAYKRYCGESSYQVVKGLRDFSLKQIQDHFAERLSHLCISTIYRMKRLLFAGFELLKMLRYLRDNGRSWLDSLADYVEAFPEKLTGLMGQFWQTEKRFLFGIPSQLR